ncbi:uncharacterized protein MELLADRAFT_116466 [Melampsora larici-populina 98AG31]|uniref:Pseudouridine synthase RsuA/RluA-like domain-containing protein n=1 Tax=Melampsora larici-populina (strain 98AG31 / pathotype 3-4-7) TaxID=747676 RepID=F4RLM7_MELLP|nr:uncharacterized protein MELLADRAFT_116466 [Melampsora larici-populina 98AG31]EGG06560.1 hypothetical protein MELLADRAFT_116466 [Melampsora larici-populina 98AG31]
MATASPAHIHTSAAKYEVKPEWYFEKGLRKVKPYLFKYSTYAKERWRGRSVIDVFSSDFRDRSPEYYAQAVASGVIKINGKTITQDLIIRNGDLITNTLHRHEPPVIGDPVRILHRDDVKGLLVVEKPGSMPIHPTGRYNYNTLLSILKFDYDLPLVHTSNRLDRLTSGVMICALTIEASRGLSAYFGQEGAVKKEYIARCRGNFPDEEIVCEEPLLTIDRQVGLNVVHPEGKLPLLGRPITGRSHQIRVHLQFLGHPILNDVIYCSNVAWGPEGGKGGIFSSPTDQRPKSSEKEEAIESVAHEVPIEANLEASEENSRPKRSGSAIKLGRGQRQGISQNDSGKRARLNPEDPDSGNCSGIAFNETARAVVNELRKARDIEDGFGREKDTICIDRAFKTPTELLNSQVDKKNDDAKQEDGIESSQPDHHEFCSDCGIPLLPDPKPEQLFIYLHAFRYHTDAWDFSSGLPWWADEEKWKERQIETIE